MPSLYPWRQFLQAELSRCWGWHVPWATRHLYRVYLRCKECNSCPPAGDGSLQQQLIMLDFVPTTNWPSTTYELHVELQLSILTQLKDVISSSAELTATLKPRSRRTNTGCRVAHCLSCFSARTAHLTRLQRRKLLRCFPLNIQQLIYTSTVTPKLSSSVLGLGSLQSADLLVYVYVAASGA